MALAKIPPRPLNLSAWTARALTTRSLTSAEEVSTAVVDVCRSAG